MAFQPGVGGSILGALETIKQTVLHCVRRVDGFTADFFHAETLDEIVGSFEVVAVLAVVLEEEGGGVQGLFGGLNGDEKIGFPDALSGRAANDYLSATFLPN